MTLTEILNNAQFYVKKDIFAIVDLFSVYQKIFTAHTGLEGEPKGIKAHFRTTVCYPMFTDSKIIFSNTYYLPSIRLEIKGGKTNEMQTLPSSCSWWCEGDQ